MESVTTGLADLKREMKLNSLCSSVRHFSRDHAKSFKNWLKDINQMAIVLGGDASSIKTLCARTLKDSPSDFFARICTSNDNVTWDQIQELFNGECSVFKKNVLWMKTMHYPNTIRSHLVTIVPMVPFTPKSTSNLRSALYIRYSKSSYASLPALILLNPNNHYDHGFPNSFDYNHYVYNDYLVCSVPAIAYIIRY